MNSTTGTELHTETEIDIPFFDADPMGVVWHGNYVKYFELARHDLLNKFDYGYIEMDKSGYHWPVVDLRLKYVKPARFGQKIRVTATLKEFENRLKVEYAIHDSKSGERLCKGHSIQVAVDKATGEMCYESPRILLQRLGVKE